MNDALAEPSQLGSAWRSSPAWRRSISVARVAIAMASAAFGGALMLNATLPIFETPVSQVRNWLLAAALLVMGSRMVNTRKEGALALGAWYAGSLASLPFIWSNFFGNAYGWAAYAALVAVLALPALLAPRKRPALGIAVAAVLAAVPPLGFVGIGNPILLAGALFPGAGWIGLALTVAALALSAFHGKAAVLGQMAILVWAAMHMAIPTPQAPELSWAAITHFGNDAAADINATYDRQDQAKRMTMDALRAGAKLVVLPEGTDPMWGAGQAFYWKDVADLARAKHAQVLIGVYTDPLEAARTDGLLDLTTGKLYPASIAVPFGMWRPWQRNDPFPSHVASARTIPTSYGGAAYLICYEELLPWPLPLQMAGDRPSLLFSAANQWFAKGWLLRPQEHSVALQARLWGLPLMRAVNYAPIAF